MIAMVLMIIFFISTIGLITYLGCRETTKVPESKTSEQPKKK